MTNEHIRLRAFLLSQTQGGMARADPSADWVDAEATERELDAQALRNANMWRPRLGAYGLNQFYIHLPQPAALMDPDGTPVASPDEETLAVFAHEYAHFLQNTSTASGWDSYERHIELLRLFSNALTDGGFCDPSVLAVESRHRVQELTIEQRLVEGDRQLTYLRAARQVEIDGLEETSHAESIAVRWRFSDRNCNSEVVSSRVGSLLVEEGLAYLFESSVRTGAPVFHEQATPPPEPVPLYPYLAYQALCRHLAPSITPATAMRLGLLALNAHRPINGLIRALCAYATFRCSGLSDAEAATRLELAVRPTILAILQRITNQPPLLRTMFQGRGSLEAGADQIVRWFHTGLTNRSRNLTFDIAWATAPSINRLALGALLVANTPCDVSQEVPWLDGERQMDLWMTSPVLTPQTRMGLRALQAQLHFMRSHLDSSGAFVPTHEVGARKCPYYSSCPLEQRLNDPATCARHPWARWVQSPTCQYGLAVAATLGTIEDGEQCA